MKIQKAIEILNLYCSKDSRCYNSDLYDSIKLGIEALKEVREARLMSVDLPHTLLPSETEK